ncbi:DUF1289 domain-containing protein [Cupriavidus sp. SW-Y-13]|uniref:DUF1289 domain-containing protein n=1 Tax=Cupriavidus sp. SW-Y-13 TaxID=2653854 RepID=UPI0013662367|nr:DUF1289 domain-containing protein [Cupriavidus sp. SW-Y-13]MWL85951.1 DUF1289 domain-containing protein [Cupriavidus sp. SW-Y-13]
MTPARRRLLSELVRGAAAAHIVSPVPSPCRSICKMDRTSGYCEGCLRTIEEIAGWSKADDVERRRIWALLPSRVTQLCEEGSEA